MSKPEQATLKLHGSAAMETFDDEVDKLLAQPERKSFSDEEITKAFTKSVFGTWDSKSYRSGFKDAEKAHGIGVADEH